MTNLPQTHHQKLVEVANTLSSYMDNRPSLEWKTEEDLVNDELYILWRGIADHLLYYDTLTNPK